MAAAGYVIELVFAPLGLIPTQRHAALLKSTTSWDCTTILDVGFLVLAAFLVIWFFRSGSGPMLKKMGGSPDAGGEHDGHAHEGHAHPARS